MKNLRIAICEDNPQDAKLLEQYLLEQNASWQIDLYASADDFLATFIKNSYDIIFFDVYMRGTSGVAAAKVVRLTDNTVSIVFTTTSKDFALESYKVSALHYIIKPVSKVGLAEALTRYKQKLELAFSKRELVLKGEAEPILLKDIMYIEVFGKKLHIHTTEGRVLSNQLLGNLQKQLPTPPFLHCHRAYIVNFAHVGDISADFLMENGDKVYIRKKDYARVRDLYFEYLLETL